MTDRPRYSTRERAKIFADADGICHICGQPVQVGQPWDAEHVIPRTLNGKDHGPNIRPAHRTCHGIKTKKDMSDIARAKRIHAAHIGAKAPSQRKIKSAGFQKKERTPKPALPPRQIYKEI